MAHAGRPNPMPMVPPQGFGIPERRGRQEAATIEEQIRRIPLWDLRAVPRDPTKTEWR